MLDSENSIFGYWGIEGPKKVPGHTERFFVADHIRAVLDLIEKGDFVNASGMRKDYICNDRYMPLVFEKVYELRDSKEWQKIDSFMRSEYYLNWVNYCDKADKRTKGP